MATTRASWLTTSRAPPKARGPTGPSTARVGASTDPGATVAATARAAMAAAEAKPHRRQPGEGADPVGVSSNTRPSAARARLVSGA